MLPWIVATIGLALTITLSWRTARVTAGVARVPISFGIDGAPSQYGPRWVAIVLIPTLHAVTLALMLGALLLRLPTHGSMVEANVAVAGAFAFAQGLFLVLLRRWRER